MQPWTECLPQALGPRERWEQVQVQGPSASSSPLARKGCQASSALCFGGLSLIQQTKMLTVLNITHWKSCLMPPLMLNCALGCQQQPLVLGTGLGCSGGAPGMDPAVVFSSWEEDGCRCLTGCFLGYYLFKKMFLHCSVLNQACW